MVAQFLLWSHSDWQSEYGWSKSRRVLFHCLQLCWVITPHKEVYFTQTDRQCGVQELLAAYNSYKYVMFATSYMIIITQLWRSRFSAAILLKPQTSLRPRRSTFPSGSAGELVILQLRAGSRQPSGNINMCCSVVQLCNSGIWFVYPRSWVNKKVTKK